MKHRKLLFANLLRSAAALALTASMAFAEPLKVGFIYVGPPTDFGWSYEHDQGRIAVEEAFGDDVETSYVESVAEGPDSERVMTQMALSGHKLIFGTTFGYMDHMINVAKKFPDVKFEHATGFKRADNVSTYSARFYEGRAVIGHIAGKMTETNKIGYVASFPIPEVIRGINSAFIHARKVNPDVEMKIVWIFSWFDPAKETDAAIALFDQGVDVIMQHTDSPAPVTVAEERGLFAFGQASDMKQFGPNSRLSSIIDNWAPYYVARTKAVMDGTWESTDTWHGIKEGMVEIGEFSDRIPEEVREEAQAIADAIVSGDYHPFTGPLNHADGSPWLAEGEVADDGTLLGMDFYVEGVNSEIPN